MAQLYLTTLMVSTLLNKEVSNRRLVCQKNLKKAINPGTKIFKLNKMTFSQIMFGHMMKLKTGPKRFMTTQGVVNNRFAALK